MPERETIGDVFDRIEQDLEHVLTTAGMDNFDLGAFQHLLEVIERIRPDCADYVVATQPELDATTTVPIVVTIDTPAWLDREQALRVTEQALRLTFDGSGSLGTLKSVSFPAPDAHPVRYEMFSNVGEVELGAAVESIVRDGLAGQFTRTDLPLIVQKMCQAVRKTHPEVFDTEPQGAIAEILNERLCEPMGWVAISRWDW